MGKDLSYSGEMPAVEAAHKLGELSLGLLQGWVGLKAAEEQLTCHPGAVVQLRIDAKESQQKGRLIIELSWPLRLEVETASPAAAGDVHGT